MKIKPALKMIVWAIAYLLMGVWLCLDFIENGSSTGGAIFFTSLLLGIGFLPVPLRWNFAGYAFMAFTLAVLLTGYFILEKERTFVESLPPSFFIGILITSIHYLLNRHLYKMTKKK